MNPLADEGLVLKRIQERRAGDENYWGGSSFLPCNDKGFLDWKENPRAALPVWLSAALQKPV